MFKKIMFLIAVFLSASFLKAAEVPAKIAQELKKFNQEWDQKNSFNDPKFSIQNTVKLLNLDYKGLEKVKSAVEAKNWDLADQELLNYFKTTRKESYKPAKKLSKDEKFLATSALKHEFKSNKPYPPLFMGVEIDWNHVPVYKGKKIADKEWIFQIQRLYWWTPMAKSYDVTKDEDYFYEWRYELVSYTDNILPLTKKTPYAIRRGMETYNRTLSTIATANSFLASDNFDSKLLRYVLWSFHHQAEHIRTVYAKQGNHLAGELYEVFRNALYFPEFKKAPEWRDEALDRFPKLMNSEMYNDGMNRELVFSYHGMYISLFANFYKFLKAEGVDNLLDPSYIERLKKSCDIMMYQTFPNWTISQFGDSWKGDGSNWAYRKHIVPLFPEDEHYQFMLTRGKKGKAPEVTNIAYPESGFYFFRTNWTPQAIFMSVKNGEAATFHNQFDNGTFELAAYGRDLMNDSGCYAYNSNDPKVQAMREHFRTTKLHQTLTLNNQNHNREPKFLFWDDKDNLTTLSFENKSYKGLTHRRTILFVDQKYFVIYDEAIGSAKGDVRIHFQFVPCKAEFDNKSLFAKTLFNSGANLAVQNFAGTSEVAMAEEEGLISYKQRKKESRPAWSYKQVKGAKDIDFLTVLAPYQGTTTPEMKSSISKSGKVATIELEVGTDKYSIEVDWANKSAKIK